MKAMKNKKGALNEQKKGINVIEVLTPGKLHCVC